MLKFKIIILFVCLATLSFAQKINHEPFNDLLKKHVSATGSVNYGGFKKDHDKFEQYLNYLKGNPPLGNWESNTKLAYWINAYNAFTIELILMHADKKLTSIKDIGDKIKIPFINTPWDLKFIEIGKQKMDLNNIEHGIIRKQFNEPRIHFALVCAAVSCPPLRNEAYTGEKLQAQLADQASKFINDPSKNSLSANKVKLSKIFDWYGGDFKGNIVDYINQYASQKVSPKAKIDYMKYDWALNGKL